MSLRARNLDAEPIKVNDKTGNPVMIGLVLVWKLKDTYKALFEVDTQTMASNPNTVGADAKGLMNALESFVRVQSDAALRQVAGQYAYDDEDGKMTSQPFVRVPMRLTSSWNRNSMSVWHWLVLRSSRLASTIWHTPLRLLQSCCVASRLMPLFRLVRKLSRALCPW